MRGPSPLAWRQLGHPERRLREKAAITLLELWSGKVDGVSDPADELDDLLRAEAIRTSARACWRCVATWPGNSSGSASTPSTWSGCRTGC